MAEDKGGRDKDAHGQRVVPADEVSQIVSDAVNRATAPLKNQIESLELKANQPVETKETKQYTRAQLNTAVSNEQISQAEADAIWDKQSEKRTTETTINLINQSTQEQRVQSEIDKYKAFEPDLCDRNSDAFQKVFNEVTEQCQLLGLGAPTLAVELNALKSLYGPSQRLKKPEQRDRQTHQDTTMNNGDNKPGKVQLNDDGSPKGLTSDERTYYQDLISKRIYTGWDQVTKEMEYADKQLRGRVAGRN